MSTRYWIGGATAVAQVAKTVWGTYDVATTRTVTIGGVGISAADSGGTLTAALAALTTLLNASTHPYFAAITWTSNATEIIGTADTAGVPFTHIGSVSGGTGTASTPYTVTTACAGPSDWSTAANWSGLTVPVAADTVIIQSGPSIAYGLDQQAVDLDLLIIAQTYTGKIGLRSDAFATSNDGATVNTTYREYRTTYLDIESDRVEVGEHYGPGTPTGSARLKLDLGVHLTALTIHNTCRTPSETGLPAVRILIENTSSKVYVRQAPGGFGIAVDVPGEVSTVDTVSIGDAPGDTRVFIGRGVTLEYLDQRGGTNTLDGAATVTAIVVDGGVLSIEAAQTVTALTVTGGVVYPNNVPAAGDAITTLTLQGGEVKATQSTKARTWASLVWTYQKARLEHDDDVVTITATTLVSP
jgi:hypothetical protein